MGPSAGRGAAAVGVREGDLPRSHHPETLPGELLELPRVPDALELSLELAALPFEEVDALLELIDLGALGQVVAHRARSRDPQDEKDGHEDHRPGRDPPPGRGPRLRASAQRENLR